MMGAHVIKVGLSPIIIDLIERKVITAIAMNSASAIHDVETALFGQTSEDVAENILDGTFGMSKETGEFINNCLVKFQNNSDFGYGEALGAELISQKAKNKNLVCLQLVIKKIFQLLCMPQSVRILFISNQLWMERQRVR